MTATSQPTSPADTAELLFVPLGGSGEIGMNLNLYGHRGKWLMVDCGVTFGDETTPGLDVIMPDPAFIEERRDDLVGLVLTHAHEDHIGAVPYLWPLLRCPVYATPFTAAVLRAKLPEAALEDELKITEIAMSGRFEIGPFALELVTLTHSIPEPNAVILRTGAGTIVHTGDWKLDPEPVVGETTDVAALRRVGEEGVLAVIGDSTNAMVDAESVSEAAVGDSLAGLVGRCAGRVTVACFASNVARLQSIATAAAKHDRAVALVGRSLWRITEAARATGYLEDAPPFLTEHDVGYLPDDKILMICTGSQGEPRAALSRIARGEHAEISFGPDDTVIFSSRVIPGNELAIGRLQNQLTSLGVTVIDDNSAFTHASGHPTRGDLAQMYQWLRPQIVVPVHGEQRHMVAHAELARACQVPHTPLVRNGDMLRLAPGSAEIVDRAETGRLALDGRDLIAIDGDIARRRKQMLWNGSLAATLVLDDDGTLLAPPKLSAPGLLDDSAADRDLHDLAIRAMEQWVGGLAAAKRRDDEVLQEFVRRKLRRFFRDELGKRPPTIVHVVRL